MGVVGVEDIRKSFGALEVLKGISFNVCKGEVLGIIGPSGSGKSTLLRCVTQLEHISSGTIRVCGDVMVRSEGGAAVYADRRTLRHIGLKVGLVFQNFNLFPHFSVLRNITEAQVRVLKVPREQARGLPTRLTPIRFSCPAASSSACR